jgi:hypothetical protein
MTRVTVRETIGGNRALDDNSTTTTERTDAMDFKKQLFDEADEREAETRRMLAGDFEPRRLAGDLDLTVSVAPTIGAVSARDAHLAREAARSRLPACGATRDTVSNIDDDDDEAASLPAASGRDAYLARELARSRQRAGGAR